MLKSAGKSFEISKWEPGTRWPYPGDPARLRLSGRRRAASVNAVKKFLTEAPAPDPV